MSIRIMNAVWESSNATLAARLVLLALADYADDRGYSYPSIKTLADKSKISERNCQYCVKKLIEMGELLIRDGAGPMGCNMFQIVVEGGAKIAPPGCKNEHGGVQKAAENMLDIAPKPSGTIKEPKKRQAAPLPEIPLELNTPEFKTAWENWVTHRKEKRSPLTPTAASGQLKKCLEIGVARATAMVAHSTQMGWLGLYEPKNYGATNSKLNQRRTDLGQGTANDGISSQYEGVGRVG